MSPTTQVLTVGQALQQYEQSQTTTAGKRSVNNLKTVLRRYLPQPSPDDSTEQTLDTDWLTVTADRFLALNPLDCFETYIQTVVEQGQIKASVVRTTYRPALVKFITAITEQLATQAQQQQSQPSKRFLIDPSQCAPKLQPIQSRAQTVRGRRSHKKDPYALYLEQLPATVLAEIDQLSHFWLDKEVPDRQDPPMRSISIEENIIRSILFFCGWLHHHKNWPIETLSLNLLLTNQSQDGVEDLGLIKEFIAWGINHRGNSYGWAMMIAKAPLAIAKWKYAAQSKRSMYRDIETIEYIRSYLNGLSKKYEKEPSPLEETKPLKIMSFEQQVAIVDYLRSTNAPYRQNHCQRSKMAIIRAWQRYLIVAFLTYCPVRQREIRELELGRTLIREAGYRVRLKPDDNKTADERDFRLVDVFPSQVIADLDQWLDTLRPEFLNQVKTASQAPDTWLEFLGYTEEELARRRQNLLDQLQQLADQPLSKDFIFLTRKLQKLEAIPAARLQIEQRLNREFVFLMLGGTISKDMIACPFSRENLRGLVVTAVFNASSVLIENQHPLFAGMDPRQTNPHFYRNNGITHERRHGDPNKRSAFHKMIGNSVREGDRTYNEMTASEKTLQAAGWWKTDPSPENAPAHLRSILNELSTEDKELLKRWLT